jgi:hypothetical protein
VHDDYRSFDVKDGECSTYYLFEPAWRPWAYGLIGAGTAMLVIGMQKVAIKPTISPKAVGASATVSWH